MAQDDFDVERLADYLHLRPDQITRMAERGKLPGRRIGGQWRFSQGEVHQWWEDRIGLSDDDELAEVETVLSRGLPTADDEFSLSAMLPEPAIRLSIDARTRNSVITAMVNLAAQTGLLWDEEKMADAIRARESLHPTALGNGVALLHPRRPMVTILAEPFCALGRTISGVQFGGGRTLTDIFFLICSTDDRVHLQTLARISRLISDNEFLSALRQAESTRGVLALVQEFEARLGE